MHAENGAYLWDTTVLIYKLGQSNNIISFLSTPFYNFMRAGGNYSLFIMQYYAFLGCGFLEWPK